MAGEQQDCINSEGGIKIGIEDARKRREAPLDTPSNLGSNATKGLSCRGRFRTGRSRSSCAASRKIRAIRRFDAQGDSFSFGIPSRSAASPSARKPPIFQEIRLAIRSKGGKATDRCKMGKLPMSQDGQSCRRENGGAEDQTCCTGCRYSDQDCGRYFQSPGDPAPPRRIPPSNKVAPRRRCRDRIEQTRTGEGSGKQPNEYHVHGLSDRQRMCAQLVDDRCPPGIPAEFALRLLARDDLIGGDRISEAPEDLARLVKRPCRYSAPGTA